MKYSEVKKEIKKEFESLLKPLGYKSKIDSQGCEFNLAKEDYELTIGFGVANYFEVFTTSIYIGIGIFKIQNIEKTVFDGSYYGTISSNVGNYFNELNYRYQIKTQEDIEEWGKIARKFYTEYAVPFFEKYNSVAAIDKLLNENPTEKVIYCYDMGWRIIKGLIAAKLNNNPKYNELRDYYFRFIDNANTKLLETKKRGFFMYESN